MAIRGTASTGFRAPSLQQQHYASSSTIGVIVPPATTTQLYPVQLLPPDNPAAIALGAKPLRPEKSTNYSVGLVAQPISRMNVRSFITSHASGQAVPAGKLATVRGIAFDGGDGIASVEFSSDGGTSWRTAKLGEDLGKFSFREWSLEITPAGKGRADWKVRAVNRTGQSQPMDPLWNPAGYMRNVVETVSVEIA